MEAAQGSVRERAGERDVVHLYAGIHSTEKGKETPSQIRAWISPEAIVLREIVSLRKTKTVGSTDMKSPEEAGQQRQEGGGRRGAGGGDGGQCFEGQSVSAGTGDSSGDDGGGG